MGSRTRDRRPEPAQENKPSRYPVNSGRALRWRLCLLATFAQDQEDFYAQKSEI
jgi:hypothetical protein